MTSPAPAVSGVVLDVGALIQMATGSSIYARAARAAAVERGYALVVPVAVLAAARAAASPAEAARLKIFFDLGVVLPVTLTYADAESVGVLLATADGGRSDDLAAGHAVLLGLQRHQRVLTDRPGVLRALAADVDVDELP